MPSLKSRLLKFMLLNRHLLKGRLHRERWDLNSSVARFRQECEEGAERFGKLPPGIVVTPVTIDGLPAGLAAEWIHPAGVPVARIGEEGVLFYTHGGGYISGSCADHRAIVAKIVQGSGIPMLLFDYRLAPEHPYPAALDDTLTAYRWLLARGIPAAKIVIVGESAGGGLALATLLALRDQGLPMPVAAVPMSPVTDLKLTGESHRTREKVAIDIPGMAEVCAIYYSGEHDPGLPYISPLYGDLHGLPPMRIYVGDDEILRDDGIRFAEKAKAAGVDVTLTVGEGMVHCYPLLAPMIPEATAALAEICAFIRQQLGQRVADAGRVKARAA